MPPPRRLKDRTEGVRLVRAAAADGAHDADARAQSFLRFVGECPAAEFAKTVSGLPAPLLDEAAGHLERTLTTLLEDAAERSAEQDQRQHQQDGEGDVGDANEDEDDGETSVAPALRFGPVLREFTGAVAGFVRAFLSSSGGGSSGGGGGTTTAAGAPDSLSALVRRLADALAAAYSDSPEGPLVDEIAAVCEQWWLDGRADREDLAPATLSYLLIRALAGRPAHLARLNAFRGALEVIDFGDAESIAPTKQLLLRCAIQPAFLRARDGRAFLHFLFGLDAAFTAELHATIKGQLRRPGAAEAYGDVFFRAWKGASGRVRTRIELVCVQDLARLAIHAAHPAAVRAVRTTLGAFHARKGHPAVDEMVARVYSPLLLRALSAPNAQVRCNAVQLLGAAFPLHNPDAPAREAEEARGRQLALLEGLLRDPSDRVRTAAIAVVCRVLGVYWDLLPDGAIRALLSRLFDDLLCDASSAAVRAAVIDGVRFLLENHACRAVLRGVLPRRLAPYVHDRVERVRLALYRLLAYLRTIDCVRFFDVVSVADLLARLAAEGPAGRERLAELLVGSFIPERAARREQAGRLLVLVRSNRAAAVALCDAASRCALVPLTTVVRLVAHLHRRVARFVEHEGVVEEAEDGSAVQLSAEDAEGMLEIAALMWENVARALMRTENAPHSAYLARAVSGAALLAQAQRFAGRPGRAFAFRMAACLHAEAPGTRALRGECFRLLERGGRKEEGQGEETEEDPAHGALIRCVTAWAPADCVRLLRTVVDWLEAPFEEEAEPMQSRRRRRRVAASGARHGGGGGAVIATGEENDARSAAGAGGAASALDRARRALAHAEVIVADERVRDAVLEHGEEIAHLMRALLRYFEPAERRLVGTAATGGGGAGALDANGADHAAATALVVRALALYCRLLMHIGAKLGEDSAMPGPEKDGQLLAHIVAWIARVVVPAADAPAQQRARGHAPPAVDQAQLARFRADMAELAARILSDTLTLDFCSAETLPQVAATLAAMASLRGPERARIRAVAVPLILKGAHHLLRRSSGAGDAPDAAALTLLRSVFRSRGGDADELARPLAALLRAAAPPAARLALARHLCSVCVDHLDGYYGDRETDENDAGARPALPVALEHVDPAAACILKTVLDAPAFLPSFAAAVGEKGDMDIETVWKALVIISVLVHEAEEEHGQQKQKQHQKQKQVVGPDVRCLQPCVRAIVRAKRVPPSIKHTAKTLLDGLAIC